MPDLLLRRNAVVKAYPDVFMVIMPMADGYELEVGSISKTSGRSTDVFWAWSCIGANGRETSRGAAMVALKAAWSVSDEQLAEHRRQQEWTEDKYALWDAGYRDKLGKGPIRCPCGEMFDPGIHEETRAHIGHITGRNR